MKLKDLKPAPYNPRKISDSQLDMLEKSMAEFGDLSGIVFNQNTGHIVGGHQRIKKMDSAWEITKKSHIDELGTVALGHIKTPFGLWQYREVAWPETKEKAANIAANRHGGDWDFSLLADLLQELDTGAFDMDLTGFDSEDLEAIMTWTPDPEKNQSSAPDSLTPPEDILFPSDNDFDIPALDPALCASELILPCIKWGSTSRRRSKNNGTTHFYTDDYKFSALWDDPTPVLKSGAIASIEPNVSTNAQMPLPVGLYWIYQKRWIARYWQSKGLKILVDLNVDPKFEKHNFLGVPRSWSAFATRGSTSPEVIHSHFDLARNHSEADSILFVVVGGYKEIQQHCRNQSPPWLHVPETIHSKLGLI